MSNSFIVEISARHIHLTNSDMEILLGKEAKLNPVKELSQPGQFASDKKLTVVGPRGEIKNVTILGPIRSETQVELSATDARTIGIDAPVRESGDINLSAGCTLIGQNGRIDIKQGVIIAKRHVHLTPSKAIELNVKDKDTVWVKVKSQNQREIIFGDVVIRVSDKFFPAMHLDTDEANAAGIKGQSIGEIINI